MGNTQEPNARHAGIIVTEYRAMATKHGYTKLMVDADIPQKTMRFISANKPLILHMKEWFLDHGFEAETSSMNSSPTLEVFDALNDTALAAFGKMPAPGEHSKKATTRKQATRKPPAK